MSRMHSAAKTLLILVVISFTSYGTYEVTRSRTLAEMAWRERDQLAWALKQHQAESPETRPAGSSPSIKHIPNELRVMTEATLKSLETQILVHANNLANAKTVGFKRSVVLFEDTASNVRRMPGVRNTDDQPNPVGTQVGHGVRITGTQIDFSQGAVQVTDRPLDVAIGGDGFFKVDTYYDGREVTAYTRAGQFQINSNGKLTLANSKGSLVAPGIHIPQNVCESGIVISSQGEVAVRESGGVLAEVGQIELARFMNPGGLLAIGSNLYLATEASGSPREGSPGEEGLGNVRQGALEYSNVDVTRESAAMFFAQKSYEFHIEFLGGNATSPVLTSMALPPHLQNSDMDHEPEANLKSGKTG